MSSITSADFNEIMRYPITDKQWFSKLCLQGAALFFLSMFFIGIPFMLGWQILLIRKGINQDATLPDWSDWGEYWKLGWKGIATGFVYAMPIWITSLLLMVPAIIMIIIVGEEFGEEIAIVGIVPMMLGALVISVWAMFMYFAQPAYMAAIAAGASFKETLQLRKFILPYIGANFVSILIAWAVAYLASMIAGLGMFIFFVGYFLTYPYAIAVIGYHYGVIYRKSTVKITHKKTLHDVATGMGVPTS